MYQGDFPVIIPQGAVLTGLVYCLQCGSVGCVEAKVVFKTSLRCEGELVHRVGMHIANEQVAPESSVG